MKRIIRLSLAMVSILALMGCAATQVALEKKDLKVETIMSDTVFLNIENQAERSVFVDVRNTSDKPIDLRSKIVNRLQQKGYEIKSNPKEAFYILQTNVLYVGKADPSALRSSVYAGWGGAAAGAGAGALIGAAAGGGTGAAYGAGIGALAGGTAELISGSLVKDVTYTIMTDVMISEKTPMEVQETQQANLSKGKGTTVTQTASQTTNRMRYQTRIASSANQVNLEFQEAQPKIEQDLARSISGIF